MGADLSVTLSLILGLFSTVGSPCLILSYFLIFGCFLLETYSGG